MRARASRLESILERRCFRERFAAPKFTFESEFCVPFAVASVLFCRFSSLESTQYKSENTSTVWSSSIATRSCSKVW